MIINECNDLHPVLERFVKEVFPHDDKIFKIVDWDSKRIYIDSQENEEFTIRMWTANMFEIDYSIFKIEGDKGRQIKEDFWIVPHEKKRRLP